jgi:hypothetical protein
MSSKQDWVPSTDEEFEDFFKKYSVTTMTNTSRAWYVAWEKLKGAHTPVPRPQAQPEADIAYPGKHLLEPARIRSALGDALEAKNMKRNDKLLEEIEGLPLDAKTREAVNAISDKALMGEYRNAREDIDTIVKDWS